MPSAPQAAKERHLVSLESQVTELVSYARKVEQDIENRYFELTGESEPKQQTDTGASPKCSTFQSMRCDLNTIRDILSNIDRKFGSL